MTGSAALGSPAKEPFHLPPTKTAAFLSVSLAFPTEDPDFLPALTYQVTAA